MIVQFTTSISFGTPLTIKEKEVTGNAIDKIQRAMAVQKLPSLFFLEDVVDRRELQNEFLLHGTKLSESNVFSLPIDPNAFVLDQHDEILSLDLTKIKPIEYSCVGLEIASRVFRHEIVQSIHEDDNEIPKKISGIFWDLWHLAIQTQK